MGRPVSQPEGGGRGIKLGHEMTLPQKKETNSCTGEIDGLKKLDISPSNNQP